MMDVLQSLDLRDMLVERAGLLLALNFIAVLLLLRVGSKERKHILPELRHNGAIWLMALLACALLIRVVYLPLGRHIFDGHEADYFDAFRQKDQPGAMGYRFYPAFSAFYRGLGWILGGGAGALEAFSIAVGLLSVALVFYFIWMLSRRAVLGFLSALLFALDPIHAFWSSSAYNVMLPFLCLLVASILVEASLKQRQGPLFAAGLLMVALAFSLRLESLFCLLPMAIQVLLGWRRGRGLPSMVLAGVPALVFFGIYTVELGLWVPRPAGADSPLDYAIHNLSMQWDYLQLLRPYDHPLLLAFGCGGLGVALFSGANNRRMALVLLLGAIPIHLIYALFDDYGTRHTLWMRLAPAVGLIFLTLSIIDRVPKAKIAIGIAGAALLLLTFGPVLKDTHKRYYATPKGFLEGESAFEGAEYKVLEPFKNRCVFVSESPFFANYDVASHFELLEPERLKALVDRGNGCVMYIYDLENYQMSSRSVHERALKVEKFMDLELLGKRLRPDLEDYALIYRVKGFKN